jgi:hypothetical protein
MVISGGKSMSPSHVRHSVRITQAQRRRGRDGESGAALVIALVVMVAMGVLVAAVVSYAQTNMKAVTVYQNRRVQRSAGDSAMKSAINWVAANYNLGRDPALNLSDPKCTSVQAQLIQRVNKIIKVSCQAGDKSNSGKPAEVGQALPEGLVLLSNRQSEPGPYVPRPCEGWWDSVAGFFSNQIFNNGRWTTDPSKGLIPETGAWFRVTQGLGFLNTSCTNVSRTTGNFTVAGDITARSVIRLDMGQLTAVKADSSSPTPVIQARQGCTGSSSISGCSSTVTNRTGQVAPFTYLNNTPRDTDPGRISPSLTPNAESIGDIADPFVPVGFKKDGSTIGTMVQRTTAYLWDATNNNYGPATSDCVGNSPTIVFLPGWYRSAQVLNQYTKSANCKNVTLWFAPDPGDDGKLLTSDDKTGAYYFDFRQGSATGCQDGANSSTRWCIGGSSDANVRVVTGTPKGWSPMGAYTPANTPGAIDPRAKIAVLMDTANTVDQDLSQRWESTTGRTVKEDAQKIDGVAAKYSPYVCVIWCFSSDRAIRNRVFSPQVSGPPIDEGAVTGDATSAPKGRVYVKVAYGVTNPASADPAVAIVTAVSPTSGTKNCGTYTLYGNPAAPAPYNDKNSANYASGLHTYTFTPVQARTLAAACGTQELINGLEVKVQITGNNFNTPKVEWYLDGVSINYDTFPTANFPNPTNSGGTGSNDVAAQKDCDDTKAGTQFIFGGESHVFVADGSLEICAGPYPVVPNTSDSVDKHVNIGLYQLASEGEINPISTNLGVSGNGASVGNPGNISAIDGQMVDINYKGTSGCCYFGTRHTEGVITIPMGGYTPPPGYRISKITSRVSYNPKNSGLFGVFIGDAPALETPGCGTVDFPKHADQAEQIASGDIVTMYDSSTGKNCLGVTPGGGALPAAGNSVKWHARAMQVCAFGCVGGPYHDGFDGMAYQISLVPTDDSLPRLIPATGCIVVHPNYNTGFDGPDCPLAKAVTLDSSDNFSFPWSTKEGQWRGRLSVQGAIYAPSAPIEIDDTDVAYPLASRGAVLRHLRVTGFASRTHYSSPPIGGIVDRTPMLRDVTFTACQVVDTANNEPCGGHDKILTRARVQFLIDNTWPVAQQRSRIPSIQWWTSDV